MRLGPLVLLFGALPVVTPTVGTAQINIERSRITVPRTGLSAVVSAGVRWRTGNVDAVSLDASSRFDLDRASVHAFLVAEAAWGWVNGAQYLGQGLVHARQVWRPRARVQFETFEQFNYDRAQLLDARALGGAGVRFAIVQQTDAQLSVGSSYMLEREWLDLAATATHAARTTHHRWSNYLAVRVRLSEDAAFAWTGYAQPRFDAFDDIRVLTDAELRARVIGRLSLTVTFFLRYDGDPPDGIDALDTNMRSGISIEL